MNPAGPGPHDPQPSDAAPVSVPAPPHDPWAHRRGEPRVFAFLWTMFILANLAGSLSWVATSTAITPTSYTPAARIMLIVIAIGITVLWPMTRLSQLSPRGSTLAACLQDLVVVLTPVHLVIWPLTFLAHWPLDVVGGLAALLSSWGLLTAAVLAVGLARPRALEGGHPQALNQRWIWMAALLAAVALVPIAAALVPLSSFSTMLSPLSGIAALTGRGLTGPMAPVSEPQWWAIAATAFVSILLWSVAVLVQHDDEHTGRYQPRSDSPLR